MPSDVRSETPVRVPTDSPRTMPPAPPQVQSATPRPAKTKSASPAPPVESLREQTELLLGQIGRAAKDFVAFAERNRFSDLRAIATQEVLSRHDVIALMLGYKLTGVAYHLLHPNPSREVLRTVRVAMVSMLLKAARDHAHLAARSKDKAEAKLQVLSLEAAEEHVKSADQEILSVIENRRGGGSLNFDSMFAGLAPTFGDANIPGQLSERFGKTFHELYARVETAVGKGSTAQASA